MKLSNFLDWTSLISNVWTILVAFVTICTGVGIYVYKKFIQNKTIELDEEKNLITSHKKVNKIFAYLLRHREKISDLKIKTKVLKLDKQKLKKDTTSSFVFAIRETYEKTREKILKRAFFLLLSDEFISSIGLKNSFHSKCDTLISEVFKIFKCSAYEANDKKDCMNIAVYIRDLNITAHIYLTKEQLKLSSNNFETRIRMPAMVDFAEIKNIDLNFEKEVQLKFIVICACQDSFWEEGDNKFILKKGVEKIFYDMYWEVGLA